MMDNRPLLEIKNLTKHFPIRGGFFLKEIGALKAVDGVSFSIKKGETLGLVGESGCGKSTLGKTILRLLEPDSGQIFFDGRDITNLKSREMKAIRQQVQIIFQDPYASLNPRMSVHQILEEPMLIHGLFSSKEERMARIYELLGYVQLPREVLKKYPHEFSGGQRQRICIARVLAVNPKLIVCDESVSALDVSIQAQVVNLLMDLQRELGLTYLFISHDLKIVKFISHQIAVMYLGRIVEMAPSESLYSFPRHPYTKSLLSAIPDADPTKRCKRIILQGNIPSPANPPEGCYFSPRCWKATQKCREYYPESTYYDGNRQAACYHPIEENE